MITDKETDTLYLSSLLAKKYPAFFNNFKEALYNNNIRPIYLDNTNDVWCHDYMPIQLNNSEFIQFKFDPSYLRYKKYQKTKSNPSLVTKNLPFEIKTVNEIIVDGGNIVKSEDKVIMTTRVIKENRQYSFKKLIEKITDKLKIEKIIFIPEHPYDFTGHADGLVRFLDDKHVLINDNTDEPNERFKLDFEIALNNAGLTPIKIPTSVYRNEKNKDANGIYINYLQMAGLVFLPIFNRPEDETVIKQFESLFSNSKIVPVLSNDLAEEGGIINCATWNIKENK
jgi:agmatine deiminase